MWDLERVRRQETGEKWKHTDMSWLLISNNSVLLDEHSVFDQHLLLRLAEIRSLNFFFLYTFCKIKSPRYFFVVVDLSKRTAPLFKKINYPSKYNYSLFPLDFLHTVSTSENFPLTYLIFFTIPPPPTPPVGDARSISLFASKGSLIALMSYSEYLPCVYLLSSFKVNVRFYFRKRLLFLYLA